MATKNQNILEMIWLQTQIKNFVESYLNEFGLSSSGKRYGFSAWLNNIPQITEVLNLSNKMGYHRHSLNKGITRGWLNHNEQGSYK